MHRALPLALALVVLVACGDDDPDVTAGTAAATTTTPPVTDPPDTEPPETQPPETQPPDTEPADTMAPVPAGWVEIDPATVDAPLAFPCCASNFFGTPSPPLSADGEPLEDGHYRLILEWPEDPAEPIDVIVRRYEQCALLPADACESEMPDFDDESLGVDMSDEYPLELALDDSVRVVLSGYADGEGVTMEGNGEDLAALLAAVDADYETAIGSRIAAGENSSAVFADVAANPQHGFSEPLNAYGGLVYSYDDAPPLLFQGSVEVIFSPDARGSNIVGPISLVVEDGHPTLVLYAGFYS